MPFPFNPGDIRTPALVSLFNDPGNPFVTTAPQRLFRPPFFPATRIPPASVAAAPFSDPGAPRSLGLAAATGFSDPGAPTPGRQVAAKGFQTPPNPFRVVGSPSSTGLSVGGRSFSRLAPAARFDNVAQHAIVLEDIPIGPDSRLVFESFPGEWEESYQLKGYRKMGGHRMAQPQFATYQGGDWGPFPLTLVFRAGIGDGTEGDPNTVNVRDIESILLAMEKKVNWLVALAFPLERQNVEGQRIINRAVASGALDASVVSQDVVSKLRRNDPPFVLLVLGTWKIIRGYLTGISWTWKPPFHPISGRPYGAEVRMQFQPLQPSYPTWQSIRNQAGTAGRSGELTERLRAADEQRVVVTNSLLQNAAARASGTNAPTSLVFDPRPADGSQPGGGQINAGSARPFGTAGTGGVSPF